MTVQPVQPSSAQCSIIICVSSQFKSSFHFNFFFLWTAQFTRRLSRIRSWLLIRIEIGRLAGDVQVEKRWCKWEDEMLLMLWIWRLPHQPCHTLLLQFLLFSFSFFMLITLLYLRIWIRASADADELFLLYCAQCSEIPSPIADSAASAAAAAGDRGQHWSIKSTLTTARNDCRWWWWCCCWCSWCRWGDAR